MGAFDRIGWSPGAFAGLDDVVLNRMHVREDLIARTDGGGLVPRPTTAEPAASLRADVPGIPRKTSATR